MTGNSFATRLVLTTKQLAIIPTSGKDLSQSHKGHGERHGWILGSAGLGDLSFPF